jgi:precorrin-8X/cobalt-precorrin-8 methylmutase
MVEYDYIRDGTAIYEKSFAIIRAEADLARFGEAEADIAIRMIHACGQVEAARHFRLSPTVSSPPHARRCRRRADPVRRRNGGAWRHACAAAGQQRGDLHLARPAHGDNRGNDRQHPLRRRHRPCGATAGRIGRGHRQCADRPLLSAGEMLRDGAPKPAAIIGMPVGFVGAAESKDALAENSYGVPFAIVRGRMGGSAMTAAALNSLARPGL